MLQEYNAEPFEPLLLMGSTTTVLISHYGTR
jgi:hypothetical protein